MTAEALPAFTVTWFGAVGVVRDCVALADTLKKVATPNEPTRTASSARHQILTRVKEGKDTVCNLTTISIINLC